MIMEVAFVLSGLVPTSLKIIYIFGHLYLPILLQASNRSTILQAKHDLDNSVNVKWLLHRGNYDTLAKPCPNTWDFTQQQNCIIKIAKHIIIA